MGAVSAMPTMERSCVMTATSTSNWMKRSDSARSLAAQENSSTLKVALAKGALLTARNASTTQLLPLRASARSAKVTFYVSMGSARGAVVLRNIITPMLIHVLGVLQNVQLVVMTLTAKKKSVSLARQASPTTRTCKNALSHARPKSTSTFSLGGA